MSKINHQRNSKVFWSSVDLRTEAITTVTPGNTKEIAVLAGLSFSSTKNLTTPETRESGDRPNRARRTYVESANPVTFSFQNYMELTGIEQNSTPSLSPVPAGWHVTPSGNVQPLSTHFLYQSLIANTEFTLSGAPNSSWANNGVMITGEREANNIPGVAPMRTNSNKLPSAYLYYVLDDLIYLLEDATLNELVINGEIPGIATETWSGFSTNLDQLTGTAHDRAASVMGGLLSNGTRVEFGANASTTFTETGKYQAALEHNVNGSNTDIQLIDNQLTDLEINYSSAVGATADFYNFAITGFTFRYANDITYLTTERLATYNLPFAPSAGGRAMSMQVTAYLVGGTDNSAQLMRNLVEDPNPNSIANRCNATVYFGGKTSPHMRIYAGAVIIPNPEASIDESISASFDIIPQETDSSLGSGNEVEFMVSRYPS